MRTRPLLTVVAVLLVLLAATAAIAADRSQANPVIHITNPPQDPVARQAILDAGNLAQGIADGSTCCFASGGLGCDDPTCEAAVCAQDAFCCDVAWDGICASEAIDLCNICQGYCCTANGTPGCSDDDCEAEICAIDSFCCAVEWDSICANEANEFCSICITQEIPTVSKTGLGVLAAAMLIGGALLLRRRRTA